MWLLTQILNGFGLIALLFVAGVATLFMAGGVAWASFYLFNVMAGWFA